MFLRGSLGEQRCLTVAQLGSLLFGCVTVKEVTLGIYYLGTYVVKYVGN